MVDRQRVERRELTERHERRRDQENAVRAARLPKGVRGLWSRLTGSYSRIRAQNELETWRSHLRDREERENMIVSPAR